MEKEAVYSGPKFQPIQKSGEIPSHTNLDNLKKWCKIFDKHNLAPPYIGGSYGNLSFNLPKNEGIIITAARSSLKDSDDDDRFATVTSVNFENRLVFYDGVREPSSETMLHYAIYDFRRDVAAVFHGHSKDISAKAQFLGIPITKKYEPYGTIALVESVTDILDSHDFIEMRDHGFLSLGRTLDEAGNRALKYLAKAKGLSL